MTTIVQKFTTIIAVGQGLLERLHNIKDYFNDTRTKPEFCNPNDLKSIKSVISKFPEILSYEKVSSIEHFKKIPSKQYVYVETNFLTLVDVIDFKALAFKVLKEAIEEIPRFNFDINPTLCVYFYDLFVLFIQVIFYYQQLEQRKVLIFAYFSSSGNKSKKYYKKIQNFEKSYGIENKSILLKRLWDELKEIASRALSDLSPKIMSFLFIKSSTNLRNDDVFSLTAHPSQLALPSKGEKYESILKVHKINKWILFSYLMAPEELSNNTDMQQYVRYVVSDSLLAHLHLDDFFALQRDWDELLSYKTKTANISKFRKSFKEGFGDGSAKVFCNHKDNRVYIRQEIEQLNHFLSDTPALVAPKLPMLLSALSIAKDELIWYLSHRSFQIKSKANPTPVEDNFIPSLIQVSMKLQSIIRKNKDKIQQYYIEYLKTADFSKLNEIVSDERFISACGEDIKTVLIWMGKWISSAQIGLDFSLVHSKWAEVQLEFIKKNSSISTTILSPVVKRIEQIIFHTQVVDSFEELLDEHGSLRSLYYFRNDLLVQFEHAFVQCPSSALVGVELAAQFPENATIFDPDKKAHMGEDAVVFSVYLIEKIAEKIVRGIDWVSRAKVSIESQTDHINSFHNILIKTTDVKKSEKYYPKPSPGSESRRGISNKKFLGGMSSVRYKLDQWCGAFNSLGSILIYKTLITPREYLIAELKKTLRKMMNKLVVIPVNAPIGIAVDFGCEGDPWADYVQNEDYTADLSPPSIIISQILNYCSELKKMDRKLNINVSQLICDFLLSQAYSSSMRPVGESLSWITDKSFEYDNNLIKFVSFWYTDFFSKKITQSNSHICYCPNRLGFYSQQGSIFKAEKYLDFEELRRLCTLIGPYGVKMIDRNIVNFILSNIDPLKETLKTLKPILKNLDENFSQESVTTQVLRTLKPVDLDNFINRSIIIGNSLTFRRLLRTALKSVQLKYVPYIYKCVEFAFKLYPSNIWMNPDFLAMDSLAQDCGVDVGTSDQVLKFSLITFANAESDLWNLLPAAYAVSFLVSTQWREAVFDTAIEGYENNVHVLQRTISDLIFNFEVISNASNNEQELPNRLVRFVNISATILLRALASPKLDPKLVPKDFPSIFIFFDRFVEENAPFLFRSTVDSMLPYPLLKSMWRSMCSRSKSNSADI